MKAPIKTPLPASRWRLTPERDAEIQAIFEGTPIEPPMKLVSDATRPAVEKARETLRVGINIQATGEATNAVVTGMVKCLLDHIDELEADLNCAVAIGRMAAGAFKPLLQDHGGAETVALMNIVNAKINDYVELHNRGDLTEEGEHAWLAMTNLRRDMEFALQKAPAVPNGQSGDAA